MTDRDDTPLQSPTDDPKELRSLVEGQEWYHTLELPSGVVTPGFFDHRPLLPKLPWPASLAGKRCLDIATFDGFWAFEMERRGADEVIGIDILDPLAWDWPVGSSRQVIEDLERRKRGGMGFVIAKEVLGSQASRLERSVYELDPDDVGTFDLVFIGSLLLHLRDPVGALERVREVCSGELVLLESIHLPLSLIAPHRPLATFDGLGRPWWWKLNNAALRRLVESAGFETVEEPRRVFIARGQGEQRYRISLTTLRHPEGRSGLFRTWYGDPHALLRVRPRRA